MGRIGTILARFGNIQQLIFVFLDGGDLRRIECAANAFNHGSEVDRLIKSLRDSKPVNLVQDLKQILRLTNELTSAHDGLLRTLFVKRNACKIISGKLKLYLAVCKPVHKLSNLPDGVLESLPLLLRAVRNLARPDGNGLQKMVKEGLCKTVVSTLKLQLLRDQADVHEMGWAAAINLAATSFRNKAIENNKGIELLVEAGACDALILTLTNPVFLSSGSIFENALWALVNISVNDDGETKLLDASIARVVMGCMRNKDFKSNAPVQEQALSALRNLCLSDRGNKQMISHGACEEAVRLLRSSVLCKQKGVVEQGLSAFANMAGTDFGQTALIKAGACEIVVRALKEKNVCTMPSVSASSLMAVANLACSMEGQQQLTRMGACEAILNILRAKNCRGNRAVNESGLLAVGNLAVIDEGQQVLLKNNAIGVVVSALQNKSFCTAHRVHDQGLGALYNLLWPSAGIGSRSVVSRKQIRDAVMASASLFKERDDNTEQPEQSQQRQQRQIVRDTASRLLSLLDANPVESATSKPQSPS